MPSNDCHAQPFSLPIENTMPAVGAALRVCPNEFPTTTYQDNQKQW